MAVTFYVNTTIYKSVNETVNANEKNKKIIDVNKFSNKFSEIKNNLFSTSLQQIILKPFGDGEGEPDKTGKLLEKLFDKMYENDKVVKEIINIKTYGLWKLPIALTKKGIVLSIRDLKIKNKQLYVKNKIYVSENKFLQLFLLQQYYDPPIHSHPRYKAMYQKIQKGCFWFDMAKHCNSTHLTA